MNRTTLSLITAVALVAGCKSAEKERVEERNEAHRELGQAQQEVNEARQQVQQADPRDVDRAQDELARAKHELHEQQQEAREEIAAADAALERFEPEAGPDESREQFTSRADARLAALKKEVSWLEKKAEGAADERREDAREELTEAREALSEADEDLAEVRGGDESVFDDGRRGVAFAINRAQRSIEEARSELTDQAEVE